MSAMELLGLGRSQSESQEVTHYRGLFQELATQGIQKRLGPDRWHEFLEAVPARLRRQVEQSVGPYDWVEPWVVGELMAAYAIWSGEDLRTFRGELYADQIMTVRHQWVLKLMNPELLVRQVPRFYHFYIQGGKAWSEQVSPGRGLVCIEVRAPYPNWSEFVLPSWFRRALTLCGGKDVQVVYDPPHEPERPHLHRFWASWT
jgi:hypothetical protein